MKCDGAQKEKKNPLDLDTHVFTKTCAPVSEPFETKE